MGMLSGWLVSLFADSHLSRTTVATKWALTAIVVCEIALKKIDG
jgi:hypothetical protein